LDQGIRSIEAMMAISALKVAILLMFAGLSIAQAAESTETLTLACQGEKLSKGLGLSGDITGQDQASMGIIVNFKDRMVNFGSEWPDPISIRNLTETAITFADDQYAPRASISGSIDRVTGDTDVAIDSTSTKFGKMTRIFSLKCKPTQRMF
jgi:hypothetical protein